MAQNPDEKEVDVVEEEEDSAVFTLTQESFGPFVQSNERVLVEFYAPWCGHCKALAPKYEEAARILAEQESPTKLAKLDATEAPMLTQQFNIEGYPTLILFEGTDATPFQAGRETEDIVNWVIKHDIPAYYKWTYQQFEESRNAEYDYKSDQDKDKEYMIFGFVKEGSKRERLFKAFAGELRGEVTMSFYVINLKEDDKYHVVLRRNNRFLFSDEKVDGELEVTYNGKLAPTKKSLKSIFRFKTYDLGTWMHEHRLPFFINIDTEQFNTPQTKDQGGAHPYSILYAVPKVPRAGIIIIRIPENDDTAVQKLKEDLVDTVRELRANDGYFVVLTSRDQPRIGFTSDVDILLVTKTIEKVPKIASDFEPMEGDPNRNNPGSYFTQQSEQATGKKSKEHLREFRYQYRINENGPISGQKLVGFIQNRDEHGRWLRSSNNTETSDDIFYDVITAGTFNQIVLDKNVDVLVLYCTSWGRYCQPFMEEYNNLAKHVKEFYKNKAIKITYLDCDENDVDDIRVDQFPQLIFYSGGSSDISKGKLLTNEQRTVDDIVDFIDEYATSLNKDEL
eukprot:213495_1